MTDVTREKWEAMLDRIPDSLPDASLKIRTVHKEDSLALAPFVKSFMLSPVQELSENITLIARSVVVDKIEDFITALTAPEGSPHRITGEVHLYGVWAYTTDKDSQRIVRFAVHRV